MTTIPFTDKCRFSPAWDNRCNAPCIGRFCETHSAVKCGVCGNQATHECNYTGQFICGFPLCDDCEGWEDRRKDSGTWGFLNHSHRLKQEHAAPVETKMVGDEI